MLTLHSVLCLVDFSEQSRQALRWASTIAQHRGGEMTVLSVVEPLLAQAAGIRLGVDLAREETEPALREFVEATLTEHQRQASHVRMEVKVGNPSEVILETARRLNDGLIVMGTHGLGGFRKLLLGSTTEQVLQRTEWPVLAVPGGAVNPPAVAAPGVQLKKILLATDFRASALAATQWATDLASEINVPLVFAHVVDPVVVPAEWQSLVAEFESDRVASGRRMLDRLSASVRHAHHERVVSVGRPADTIASLAAEYGVGLVVMGLAHDEDSELRRPGSIAYRVLRLAHVAVVVVPSKDRRLPRAGQSQRHASEVASSV
jgi:nucleotide-binding universal stress UspA family protein